MLFFIRAELLLDLIKNLQFSTKQQDEVIIRQGDQGDWFVIDSFRKRICRAVYNVINVSQVVTLSV